MTDLLKFLTYASLFIVPFLTMFVVNDYFFPFITGKNFAFRIIVEIGFVAWALLALLDAKYRQKFSWILTSFASLLIVMFVANLLGQDPGTSFWSNFERMDGYVTLVHVFLYVVVLGSVLTTKSHWNAFLHTTVGVATLVSFYGLTQYSDAGGRIESFLGNAAYLAIYLYFHVFIVFWLFVNNRSTALRVMYALLAVFFVFILVQTGTRGTAIGLAAGMVVTVLYIAIFGAKFPEFRRFAIGASALVLLTIGGFFVARDSDFIQSNASLARIANIDLKSDLTIRATIWGMGWEGVKERPVLGWGQGNFNYVFNEQYEPALYGQEQWFDRAHNIFLDWLTAGGFLGLIAYLSIFAACLYYLIIVPWRKPEDQTFTVLERGVLLGALSGYTTHNLVVFDNIVSYIFFAVVLALIHSRVGVVSQSLGKFTIDKNLFNQCIAPVAAVALVAIIYTMHIPGMQAAGDIIDGYRAATPAERLAAFERALDRGSFAHQEITEQIAQQAMSIVRDDTVPEAIRMQFVTRAEQELIKLAAEKPGDARVHVFFSTFYRALGNYDQAAVQMQLAREFSPNKPSIIMQQAITEYGRGDMTKARQLFEEAFRLDERNDEAREYYAASLIVTGDVEAARALIINDQIMKRFALSDFIVQVLNERGDTQFLIELYESRVQQKPEVAQNWGSLSFLYYKNNDNASAIKTLNRSIEEVPDFAPLAQCFIKNIEAGRVPDQGCIATTTPTTTP